MSEPHTGKICPKRYVSIRRSSVRQDLHMCMVDADYAISIMVVFFKHRTAKASKRSVRMHRLICVFLLVLITYSIIQGLPTVAHTRTLKNLFKLT